MEHAPSTFKPNVVKFEAPLSANGWPAAVKGGQIIDFITPSDNGTRKSGGLGRNIIGDCTVKNQYQSYYGPDSRYYGGNAGSRNVKNYDSSRLNSYDQVIEEK